MLLHTLNRATCLRTRSKTHFELGCWPSACKGLGTFTGRIPEKSKGT